MIIPSSVLRPPSIVIFGGTAAYSLDLTRLARIIEERVVETPFGPSPRFKKLITDRGTAVWFASRHGEGSLERSARFVNHRANVWTARELNANLILSWNGVGAIHPSLRVGDAIVPEAIMDWTRNRVSSFLVNDPPPPPSLPPADLAHAQSLRMAARTHNHILHGRDPRQAARPFDETARQAIQVVSSKWQVAGEESKIQNEIYVCTEGPRLETAAEIELAADLGADVVGMTLCPEVWLAAELGLGYASLCLVTNFATGRWRLDPRRDFGPAVAERGLNILLRAAEALEAV